MIYLSFPPGTTSNLQPATSNTKTAQLIRIIIQSVLFLLLLFSQVARAQQSQQLTQNELNVELRIALERNDEARIVELIKNHRLFIKPFVDALVKESISLELKGKFNESEHLNEIAAHTAEVFNNIFSEKSLLIAVNYLNEWNKEQKKRSL